MTLKLIEQVHELQAKMHVCTECKGQKTVIVAGPDGWTLDEVDCAWCDGTGRVEAPEFDALVEAIEVLASAVDARDKFEIAPYEPTDIQKLFYKYLKAQKIALSLIQNGLPDKEETNG